MNSDQIREKMRETAAKLDTDLCGIAPVERFRDAPESFVLQKCWICRKISALVPQGSGDKTKTDCL